VHFPCIELAISAAEGAKEHQWRNHARETSINSPSPSDVARPRLGDSASWVDQRIHWAERRPFANRQLPALCDIREVKSGTRKRSFVDDILALDVKVRSTLETLPFPPPLNANICAMSEESVLCQRPGKTLGGRRSHRSHSRLGDWHRGGCSAVCIQSVHAGRPLIAAR
jgi:hypothetical protein